LIDLYCKLRKVRFEDVRPLGSQESEQCVVFTMFWTLHREESICGTG